MLREWDNYFEKKRINPRDETKYLIPRKIIGYTEEVLADYGSHNCEGLVYWSGRRSGNIVKVMSVIVPEIDSSSHYLEISHSSHFHVVDRLNDLEQVHLAQIHSHPEEWVGHSYTDDEKAAFKIEGLVSIVVPNYCEDGMVPLEMCGIHRFTNNEFRRLHEDYIIRHFELTDENKNDLIDLR